MLGLGLVGCVLTFEEEGCGAEPRSWGRGAALRDGRSTARDGGQEPQLTQPHFPWRPGCCKLGAILAGRCPARAEQPPKSQLLSCPALSDLSR